MHVYAVLALLAAVSVATPHRRYDVHPSAAVAQPVAASQAVQVCRSASSCRATTTVTITHHYDDEEQGETPVVQAYSGRGRRPSSAGVSASSASRRGRSVSPRPQPTATRNTPSRTQDDENEDDVDAEEEDDAEPDTRPRDPSVDVDPTAVVPVAARRSPRQPIRDDVFYQDEEFVLFNKHKNTCASVKISGLRKRLRLVTERCSTAQAFVSHSRFSFHWVPANDNNLSYLAINYKGKELCAHSRFTGTYFFPCDNKSMKFSLGATKKHGQFKVRNAGRSNKCLDDDHASKARFKHCGAFRDQAWSKIHVGFEEAIKRGIEP